MKGYTVVLGILISVFVVLLALRSDLDTTILRLPGQLYQHQGDSIRNIYTFRILNKTANDYNNLELRLISTDGKVSMVGKKQFDIKRETQIHGTVFVDLPMKAVTGERTKLKIGIYAGDKLIETKAATFMGPREF